MVLSPYAIDAQIWAGLAEKCSIELHNWNVQLSNDDQPPCLGLQL